MRSDRDRGNAKEFAADETESTVRGMVRRMLFAMALLLLGARPPSAAAESAAVSAGLQAPSAAEGGRAPRDWRQVDVATTKTSIYIGTVTMEMPTFTRGAGTYTAPYAAKVFPYFFYNESGTLTVDVTDPQLQDLAAGKPIDFSGTAVRKDGALRRVTAKATPADASHGKLDVHVFVSKRIQLIFHTTYRFR